MLKRIHINQHKLKRNRRNDEYKPIIGTRTYKGVTYSYRVYIAGQSELKWSPDKPLKCGAKAWVETEDSTLSKYYPTLSNDESHFDYDTVIRVHSWDEEAPFEILKYEGKPGASSDEEYPEAIYYSKNIQFNQPVVIRQFSEPKSAVSILARFKDMEFQC